MISSQSCILRELITFHQWHAEHQTPAPGTIAHSALLAHSNLNAPGECLPCCISWLSSMTWLHVVQQQHAASSSSMLMMMGLQHAAI
jgi:hypothetical protein